MAERRTPEEYFNSGSPVRVVQGYPIPPEYITPPPATGLDPNLIILGVVAICFFGLLAVMVWKK